MINVAHFTNFFEPNLGGVEIVIANYCQMVDKSKFSSHIISSLDNRLSENFTTYNYADFSNIKKYNIIPKRFIKLWRLKKYLIKNNIKILHIHKDNICFLATFSMFFRNNKFFLTIHGDTAKMFEKEAYTAQKQAIKKLIKQNNLQLIALHDDARCKLNEIFDIDNTIIIPNGIDMDIFNPNLYNSTQIRKTLGFNKSDFIIGNVGRFADEKNHKKILSVFSEVLKHKPSSKLLLVGNGELKENILAFAQEKGITNKVLILENRKDIPELLSTMDVFLFPSLHEGFPLSLIEAQAMNLRCIVSNTVTKHTHLTRNFAFLSLKESDEEWARLILSEEINNNPIGNLENYNIKNIIKNLENLYTS